MSARWEEQVDAVLREFGSTGAEQCECDMADEIIRLRAQLALIRSIVDPWSPVPAAEQVAGIQALVRIVGGARQVPAR